MSVTKEFGVSNSALSLVVHGDIAPSINKQYNTEIAHCYMQCLLCEYCERIQLLNQSLHAKFG